MYISNPHPSPPPIKKLSMNTFNIFSQFYSFCTGLLFFMKFTSRAATSFSLLEEPRTSINGVNKRIQRVGDKHTAHGGNVQKQRNWDKLCTIQTIHTNQALRYRIQYITFDILSDNEQAPSPTNDQMINQSGDQTFNQPRMNQSPNKLNIQLHQQEHSDDS